MESYLNQLDSEEIEYILNFVPETENQGKGNRDKSHSVKLNTSQKSKRSKRNKLQKQSRKQNRK